MRDREQIPSIFGFPELALLIEEAEGYHCTGAYRCMEEAIEGLTGDLPDVALVDIGLPGM